jgi:anti-sigma factor RsiW
MNCSEVDRIVQSLLAGEGADPFPELLEHLRDCQTCEDRFATLLTIALNLEHLPDRKLPEGFDARFWHRLARRAQRERKKAWQSLMFSIAANDEVRWVLMLLLSVGSAAVALGNSAAAPRHPLLVSASNIAVMAVALLLAAAFVHAVSYSDFIVRIFRRKMR